MVICRKVSGAKFLAQVGNFRMVMQNGLKANAQKAPQWDGNHCGGIYEASMFAVLQLSYKPYKALVM